MLYKIIQNDIEAKEDDCTQQLEEDVIEQKNEKNIDRIGKPFVVATQKVTPPQKNTLLLGTFSSSKKEPFFKTRSVAKNAFCNFILPNFTFR